MGKSIFHVPVTWYLDTKLINNEDGVNKRLLQVTKNSN